MALEFPTRLGPGRHLLGAPDRADACACVRGPLVGSPGDTCIRCGRYPQATVSATFHRRAEAIARRGRDRKQARLAA